MQTEHYEIVTNTFTWGTNYVIEIDPSPLHPLPLVVLLIAVVAVTSVLLMLRKLPPGDDQ